MSWATAEWGSGWLVLPGSCSCQVPGLNHARTTSEQEPLFGELSSGRSLPFSLPSICISRVTVVPAVCGAVSFPHPRFSSPPDRILCLSLGKVQKAQPEHPPWRRDLVAWKLQLSQLEFQFQGKFWGFFLFSFLLGWSKGCRIPSKLPQKCSVETFQCHLVQMLNSEAGGGYRTFA